MSTPSVASPAIRWLNLGSCVVRSLFNPQALNSVTINGRPLPVDFVSGYRRPMSSMRSDWDEVPHLPELDATDRQFVESWSLPRSILDNVDIVCVDLAIDALYATAPRFCRESEASPRAEFDQLITNFPFPAGDRLAGRLGMFECEQSKWFEAWQWFARNVLRPTVFLFMEERSELAEGYVPAIRERLLDYQRRIEDLSREFPHWHCVHIDQLLCDRGTDYYVDRHHLTTLGLDVLRCRLLTWLDEAKILQRVLPGAPLGHRGWLLPERADFVELPSSYPDAIAGLYRRPVLIGAPRTTGRLQEVLSRSGIASLCGQTCTAAPQAPEADAVIYLQWAQFGCGDARVRQIREKYPEAFVEVPSQFHEHMLVSSDELALRTDMRRHVTRRMHVDVESHPDQAFRRYLVRVLLRRMARWPQVGDPGVIAESPDGIVEGTRAVLGALYARWKNISITPLFCEV
jgi:hypothetical protein